ncbi:hypothetical protein KSS87_015200 [Heliosperma pusillum]|nr:hypothetical protein KSS87_015200 [Heliosperma pusillum]
MMESGASNSSTTKSKYPGIRDGSWFTQFRYGSNPWMARYVYGFIFLVTNFLAWVVRDYGQGAIKLLGMKQLGRFKECHGGRDCSGTIGVLRVSLGCFLEPQRYMIVEIHGIQGGGLQRLPWEIAHFGAGIFLLIQLVSVITFITWLNDCFQTDKTAERCRVYVTIVAIASYFVCIVGIILMYLCEPPGTICNRRAEASKRTDWLTIISFIVALLTIVFATFSTGIDSQCFQFLKKETEEEEDVQYGYGFFHLVFATGAMYFAMLLVGWNSHHHMKKWTIDVGWTSTWVRIVNEWLAACVYIWMLVAPVILKNRQVSEIP